VITPVVTEDAWINVLRNAAAWQPPRHSTMVIAPHPDDETLAIGGLIASQRRAGIPVKVIAVTDGESAYAGVEGLGPIRQAEQERALEALGVSMDQIIRLRLPDSNVTEHESHLASLLTPLFVAGSLIVAPWHFDFHPDHEACGRATQKAARLAGATLVSYVFWTWHRGLDTSVIEGPICNFGSVATLKFCVS
jgi:LmbE family N-acetylglucosaminyl deacetylase